MQWHQIQRAWNPWTDQARALGGAFADAAIRIAGGRKGFSAGRRLQAHHGMDRKTAEKRIDGWRVRANASR